MKRVTSWPWTFLKSVKRLPGTLVKTIEEEASRRGKIVGVRLCLNEDTGDQPLDMPPSGRKKSITVAGAVPARVDVVSANLIYIDKSSLPSSLIDQIIRIAARGDTRPLATTWKTQV